MPSPRSDNERVEPLVAPYWIRSCSFAVGRRFQVTDPDDLLSNERKFAVGALGSVFQDGHGLIVGATKSGHQNPLSEANSVASDDCLRQIVTRDDVVDCQARTPGEQFGYVALVFESTALT
jgi:hypothetical protein